MEWAEPMRDRCPIPETVSDDFDRDGYALLPGLFSAEELRPFHELLLERYARFFDFSKEGSPLERIEGSRPLDPSAKTRVDDLRPAVHDFARRSRRLAELFDRLLRPAAPQSLELSRFCDFRINVPRGARLRKPTAWHQDVQTDYCYFPDQMKHASATCWIALSRATPENSIELIPRSHRPRKIFYQDFRNRRFDPTSLRAGADWGEPVAIDARCGDAVVLDPFVWHRSVVNRSNETRFSFDVRFLDTGDPAPEYRADPRLLGLRYLHYGYAASRRLLSIGR